MHRPLPHFLAAAYLFLMMQGLVVHAASGTWSILGEPALFNAAILTYNPQDNSLWVAGATLQGVGTGTTTVVPHIASRPLASGGTFQEFSNNQLTNTPHDLLITGLFINKLGIPTCRTLRSASLDYTQLGPHLYSYNSSTGAWGPSTTPANEQSNWNGGPNVVIDDNGDLVGCGNTLVLKSADGTVWNTLADLRNYIMAPAPYTNVGSAAGKASWFPPPAYQTNIPSPNPDGFDWVTSAARMPWGEIFIGGECGSYVHSLDNGQTWEWFDPCMSVPQRDMQGIPMYPHPGCFRISKTFDAVATKDGEVMFNCQRNDGHHFFTWTAAGNVIETAQGLPSGTIWPEVCSNFVTVKASGDTFMSVMWSNYNIASHPNPYADLNPPSPTHHGYDLFKWDGTSWTIVTADYASLGWWVAVPNGLATDGHSLYLPTYETTNNGTARIRIWTPDLSAGNPPNVAITGSGSATGSPTATMDSTTGRAFVPLTTSVFADNSVTIQWAARGPAAVVFDDPNALSPTAWFTMPGNYVLNMRATDTVTHLSAGSSVIVHILPANSGTPPAILTQPVNQLGVISGTGSATFTVQASGTGPLRYQWKRNGIDIAGNNTAQSSALTISTKFVDDGSVYHCVVSNPWGSVVSNAATLGTPPVILANPVSQIVSSGGYAAFSVSASGTQRFQWQWLRNGTPITTGDPKTHNSGTFATNVPGTYSVVVSNMFGSVTSGTATLTVGTPPSKFFLVLNAVASPSTSGGDINAEDGTYVSASYPINTNIPIGAEVTPLNGSYFQFDKWTVTTGGSVATVNAPQTTAKATTAGSTVVYTTNYKDSSSLPLYFLNVVNGIGCGLGRASVFQPTSPVTMNIAAAPAPTGYTFHHWTGSGVASTTSASTTVTLTNAGAETAVVAHYVVAPYTLWKQQVFGTDATNPAVAGDLADPDHDGLTNLVEYAINSQPLDVASGKSSLVVDTETAAGSKYLRLTVPKNSAATDATYTVQVSSDLRTWDAASTVVESNTSTTLSVRDSVAFTSATRRFIRLQVTLQ